MRAVCRLAGIAALAVGLVLLPSGLAGQVIRGVVVEEDGVTPIIAATIDVLRADSTPRASTTSDDKGWFQLEVGEAGTYLVRPAHLSYRTMRFDTVSVGAHEIVTVVLRMGRAAIPLEPLVVTARSRDRLSAFRERAERGGQGRFIRRDYIASRVAAPPSQLLMMTPGVRVVRDRDGINIITMRAGGRRCAAALFLDGLPVPQDWGMGIDELTASDMIEGIEIYDAHVMPPAEFRLAANDCGVVAFWSRPEAFRPWTWKRLGIAALLGALFLLLAR